MGNIKIVIIEVITLVFFVMTACGGGGIHKAVEDGDIEAVKKLLNKDAKLSVLRKNGLTPLDYAAYKGHKEIAGLLLSRGAEIEERTYDGTGRTPLHIAAEKGNVEFVRFLISRGAQVNAQAKGNYYSSWTPLHFAVKNQHYEIVEVLIALNDTLTFNNPWSPMHVAAENNCIQEAKLLLPYVQDIDNVSTYKGNLLHIAALNGHKDIVELLISRGADVNAINHKWRNLTGLHYAAWNGHIGVAQLLITKGADLNFKDSKYQMTPLHIAAIESHLEMVEYLVAQGVDVNPINKKGEVLLYRLVNENYNQKSQIVNFLKSLHRATQRGDIARVKTILKKYPKLINIKDENYRTPLHEAIANDKFEIAKLLIHRGADINVQSKYRPVELRSGSVEKLLMPEKISIKKTKSLITPMQIAKDKGYKELIELMNLHGSNTHVRND